MAPEWRRLRRRHSPPDPTASRQTTPATSTTRPHVSSSVAVTVWPGPPTFTMARSTRQWLLQSRHDRGRHRHGDIREWLQRRYYPDMQRTSEEHHLHLLFVEYHANRLRDGNFHTHHCNGRKGNLRHYRIGNSRSTSPVAFTTYDYDCRRSGGIPGAPSPRRQESEAPETSVDVGSTILIATIASLGMAGCGGGPTTAKGTYAIQVVGTAGSLSQSATYSLTVQ